MSQVPDVASLIAGFPFAITLKIIGRPTYPQINKLLAQLKENAGSVNTSRGGGNNGHIGMLMTNAEYGTISATPGCSSSQAHSLKIPAETTTHQQRWDWVGGG